MPTYCDIYLANRTYEYNWQIYMQLKTSRSEEVRIKMKSKKRRKQKEKIDIWCSKHKVSKKMRSLIVEDMNGRFKEDEDVYLENLLPNLPGNFQSEVKQHICLKRLKEVSSFTSINLQYNRLPHT